jgi:hypothetical protein
MKYFLAIIGCRLKVFVMEPINQYIVTTTSKSMYSILALLSLVIIASATAFRSPLKISSSAHRQPLSLNSFDTSFDSVLPLYGGLVAIIGVGAGYLQYSVYQGKQGLGKYLSDGKGFQNSAYKLTEKDLLEQKQNAPKFFNFKLPKLDFVEVYEDDDFDDDTEGIKL